MEEQTNQRQEGQGGGQRARGCTHARSRAGAHSARTAVEDDPNCMMSRSSAECRYSLGTGLRATQHQHCMQGVRAVGSDLSPSVIVSCSCTNGRESRRARTFEGQTLSGRHTNFIQGGKQTSSRTWGQQRGTKMEREGDPRLPLLPAPPTPPAPSPAPPEEVDAALVDAQDELRGQQANGVLDPLHREEDGVACAWRRGVGGWGGSGIARTLYGAPGHAPQAHSTHGRAGRSGCAGPASNKPASPRCRAAQAPQAPPPP